jgi:CHASE3 domain sensor protein
MLVRLYQSNTSRTILRWIRNTINQMEERERSNSISPGGEVIRIKEVDVVEAVGGVIQMVVEAVVVEEAEGSQMVAATNTMTSLEIIIQGTITTEEEEAEAVATTTTMVLVVKLIMLQVMLGCNLDML